MNILGLSGTPRQGGNSELLLDHALRPFEETSSIIRVFRLSERSVAPCRGCDACLAGTGCVIDDDMKEVCEAFRWCDALLIATPVYYRTVTAQLLALMQRHYAVRNERPLLGKPGGAMAVGRGTGAGQATAIATIYTWMLSCGMICVPGELNGVTAAADAPGDILKQPNRLRQAEILGRNVMEIATRLSLIP